MFEITYRDDKLVVSSDTPFIPVIRGFLKKQGFEEPDDRHMIVKTDNPYDIIISTQSMLGMYDQCNLDSKCQEILDRTENVKLEFQCTVRDAEESQETWQAILGEDGCSCSTYDL